MKLIKAKNINQKLIVDMTLSEFISGSSFYKRLFHWLSTP